MAKVITKETFKQKVVEGFIIGVMVSLTIAVCATVWNAFDHATRRLEAAENLLEQQKDLNDVLLKDLAEQQKGSTQRIEELAADLQDTRKGLENRLTELAAAINKLAESDGSPARPAVKEDFGEFDRPLRFNPAEQVAPDFDRLRRDYKDIIRQETLGR